MVQAFGQKEGQLLPGIVAIQSMQVKFGLHNPATPPQIAEYTERHAVAQVVRFVPAFEAVLKIDLAVQAFVQGCAFVGDELLRSRGGGRASQENAIRAGKRFHARHGDMKGAFFRVGMRYPGGRR